MGEDDSFTAYVRRLRSGDAQAAVELVRQYESTIRLEVRMRLRDPRLRRQFDSMDVCQSVLATFFVRAAAGQFDLEQPEQLVRLLVGIARNKLSTRSKHHRAQRRDARKVEALDPERLGAASSESSPSELVAGEELLREFRRRLSEEEQRLADLRGGGHAWADIAAQMGGTPDGRRVQLDRAVSRVSRELGLEEDNGE
jgi:RNA polymerase sigma-70 factor (ECF subfamily)